VLDLKQIRRDPDPVREALARRRDGSEERLERVLELDERTRALRPEVENLRASQNEAASVPPLSSKTLSNPRPAI